MKNVHVHTLLPYACMHLLLHIFLSTCELLALLGIHTLLYPFSLLSDCKVEIPLELYVLSTASAYR